MQKNFVTKNISKGNFQVEKKHAESVNYQILFNRIAETEQKITLHLLSPLL